MSATVYPRLISCDEAGFTGNNMLNPEQPYFTYASHDLTVQEAEDLLRDIRGKHNTQMPELKAQKLLRNQKGRDLIADVLGAIAGRYMVSIYDKKLSLTGKMFEYIYEPVLARNSALFYRNNLHRFVAMYLYVLMLDAPIQDLAAEFERFMRSLDPADAPTLFGGATDADHPISQILRFARGYNVPIAAETESLKETRDTGKWVLDLTVTAVFSHLVAWGERHPVIEVVCDDSKPLRALGDVFDGMIDRTEIPVLDVFGRVKRYGWNMSKPLEFASSGTHAGIQLADLVAGVTAMLPGAAENRPDLAVFSPLIEPHLHDESIMPDMSYLDLEGTEAAVNWMVLEELADRADAGADPLEGMDYHYHMLRATLPYYRRRFLSHRPADRARARLRAGKRTGD